MPSDPYQRHTAISGGEWVVQVVLEVDGRQVCPPHELRYGDTILVNAPETVGLLIRKRMQEVGVTEAKRQRRQRRR